MPASIREIHHRLRWFGQFVSGVAHDTDDLVSPNLVTPPAKADQVLADRVLIREVLSHELRANYDLMRGVKALVGAEGSAAEQWDLDSVEIAWVSPANDRK